MRQSGYLNVVVSSLSMVISIGSAGCGAEGTTGAMTPADAGVSAIDARAADGSAPVLDAGAGDAAASAAMDAAYHTPNPDGARPFDPALLDQPYTGPSPPMGECHTLSNTAPLIEIENVVGRFPDPVSFPGGPIPDGVYEAIAFQIYADETVPRSPGHLIQRTIGIDGGAQRLLLVEKFSDGQTYEEARGLMTLTPMGSALQSTRICGFGGTNLYQYALMNDLLIMRFERGASILTYRRR